MRVKKRNEVIEADMTVAMRKTEAFMTMCYTIRAGPLSHYQPHRRWLRAQEAACTLLCVLRRQATAVSGIRHSRERGWTDIRKQTQNELYSLKPNFSLKAIEISVENGDFFVRNELESRNHTLDLLNY